MISASGARGIPSPLGEKVPVVSKTRLRHDGRMRGPSAPHNKVAPHQFGQMTYDRATKRVLAVRDAHAAVSHCLTSSPPRGEVAIGHRNFPFALPQAGRGRSASQEMASC